METGIFTVEISLEQYETFKQYFDTKLPIPVTTGPFGFEFYVDGIETRFHHGVHSHLVKLRQIKRVNPDGQITGGS